LFQIATQKYQQGLGKPQDVNETKSNYLTSQETARQVEFLIRQQYNALKILCDIPDQDSILIGQFINDVEAPQIPQVAPNRLEVFNSLMKEKMAWSSYRQARFALLPTVSLFWSNTSQQFNTRSTLFDQDVRWIPSSFLGVKLNWNIPSAQAVAQISKTRYDHSLTKLNTEHLQSKMEIEAKQLSNDYLKAASQTQTYREIFRLKRDTYTKNLGLYNAGLIGLDQVMNNYNALVNSHYNLISSTISVLLAEANIALNNNPK
jgi:outer membrane protein TolC